MRRYAPLSTAVSSLDHSLKMGPKTLLHVEMMCSFRDLDVSKNKENIGLGFPLTAVMTS